MRIRPYQSPSDLDAQYDLWLRATEALPFAWRSNIANTRAFASHVPGQPGTRLFGEREDGTIVGYIGVNRVMAWEGLGQALPFGYAWTWPENESLAEKLYQQMFASLPALFPGAKIDALVQRFRRSWKRNIACVRRHGWVEHDAEPILAAPIEARHNAAALTKRFQCGDEASLVATIALDPVVPPFDEAVLRRRLDAGWYESETMWLAPGAGAFQFEMRAGRAEVKFFRATPEALDAMLDELRLRAAESGATLVYFTLESDLTQRRNELVTHGFTHVDDDVYVVKRMS